MYTKIDKIVLLLMGKRFDLVHEMINQKCLFIRVSGKYNYTNFWLAPLPFIL